MNVPLTEANSLGTSTTTYDVASQSTSITDADGRERDYVHDNLGRLTAENWMQGGTAIASMNYAYDAANELTAASRPNSSYAFTSNGDAQVTAVDRHAQGRPSKTPTLYGSRDIFHVAHTTQTNNMQDGCLLVSS